MMSGNAGGGFGVSTIAERELIHFIREASVSTAPDLIKSIGDDCAVFGKATGAGQWLISTDTLVDGVHFDRSWHAPELLGRKSVAVNLSDIAAMGGRPRFVLLSLCLPPSLSTTWLHSWLAGATAILAEYDCVVIGGDTVRGSELVISVTVLGEPAGKQALYRCGAKPGDVVFVSGPLGSAAAGLALLQRSKGEGVAVGSLWQELLAAHLNPVPQIELGQALAMSGWVTAMQDISDGLATDLAHICQESGVGSRVYAEKLPCLPILDRAALFLGQEKKDLQLKGGDDYQLVFTVRAGQEIALQTLVMTTLHRQIYQVGVITEGCGVIVQKNDGSLQDMSFQGYEH